MYNWKTTLLLVSLGADQDECSLIPDFLVGNGCCVHWAGTCSYILFFLKLKELIHQEKKLLNFLKLSPYLDITRMIECNRSALSVFTCYISDPKKWMVEWLRMRLDITFSYNLSYFYIFPNLQSIPDSSLDEDSRCPSNPIVCQPASTVRNITGALSCYYRSLL